MRKKCRKKILIIDDHAAVRDALACILRYKGYEPLEAKDGYAGMAMILTEHPDLVIMDLLMPGLSGLDTARMIKANPKTAHLPMIAFTAWEEKGMRVKARKAGITSYLIKPVASEVLVKEIEKLTRRSRRRLIFTRSTGESGRI
jgi:DNA-binding response OmpR family regulator